MANYLRPRIPGATIFFTVALARRGSGLLVDHVEDLREAVRATRQERPFGIDAWVVLPDHLHAVWTLPPGDADYSTRWSVIKARFSRCVPEGDRRASHVARRERGVWQRRFWDHHVRGPGEYAQAIRYCHQNPVWHGLVERPEDWAHSSVHRDIRAGQGV
ncbi:MAG: transposase [Rhodobacteraceae bacterium]|nr:transposase [Paracoccaceae bacterium]MAY46069.1 transposase [Paracoccaceae bacterium]